MDERLTTPPIRSLPIRRSRFMCSIEELYEFSIPNGTGLIRKLDGFCVTGCAGADLTVGCVVGMTVKVSWFQVRIVVGRTYWERNRSLYRRCSRRRR